MNAPPDEPGRITSDEHAEPAGDDASGAPDGSSTASGPVEPQHHDHRARALAQALLVTAVSAAALSYAFRYEQAGPARMLPPIGGAYATLAIGAIAFGLRRGDLREQLSPRRLDVTLGALVAGVLYLVCSLVPAALLHGRPQEGWLWRLYLQLGDPHELAMPQVGVAVLGIAALEEFVWRGWAMRALQVAYGPGRALAMTTTLYAVAHVATLALLGDPEAGPNPLVVAAAAGCGLAWGAMAWRFERLAPSLFAHALFSWAMALFPIWTRRG